MKTGIKRTICLTMSILMLFLLLCGCAAKKQEDKEIVIGIAWRGDPESEFYTNITDTLDDMNIKYRMIDQVKLKEIEYDGSTVKSVYVNENDYLEQSSANLVKTATAEDSNVAAALEGISGVIFTGGEDISPTLYKTPESWHAIADEKDYNAARDISDYLLLAYCIEKDIPVIGFCRGMQMMGVVCGATVIQDIPTYFDNLGITYDFTHRNIKATPESYRDYAPHTVSVLDKESALYKTVGSETVENAPSWHHQAVLSVDGTNLKITGVTETCGVQMIEALEYIGKTFIVGYQFHPEAAVAKNLKKADNASSYMSKDTAEKFFSVFIGYCK